MTTAIPAAMRRAMIEDEIKAAGPAAQAIFRQCLHEGSTIEWAAMCALRSPPGSKNTDRAFCQGAQRQMDGMAPHQKSEILKRAKAAGIQTQGKFYKGSLGRYTDPAAWVSSADDLLAVAKAKNLHVDGVIRHNAVDIDPPKNKKKVKLAPDLVARGVQNLLKSEPDTAAKVRENPKLMRTIQERVIDKHTRKK